MGSPLIFWEGRRVLVQPLQKQLLGKGVLRHCVLEFFIEFPSKYPGDFFLEMGDCNIREKPYDVIHGRRGIILIKDDSHISRAPAVSNIYYDAVEEHPTMVVKAAAPAWARLAEGTAGTH